MTDPAKDVRLAFDKRDVDASLKAHQDPRDHTRSDTGPYVADFVYGATDGIVTTFAVVSGVEGAQLDSKIVLILGVANLLADGLSMAIGNFLGRRAEMKLNDLERARELWEIENLPEEEKKEIRNILASKDVTGEDLDYLTETICRHPKLWVDMMMAEELNLTVDSTNPIRHGLTTLFAFISIGTIPLLGHISGYFVPAIESMQFGISIGLTLIALIIVGVIRKRLTKENLWASVAEVVTLGGSAAAIAYTVGWALKSLVS
jgi:VIT1/CCC1 family predicted Fe2+/Mn2+ transporter